MKFRSIIPALLLLMPSSIRYSASNSSKELSLDVLAQFSAGYWDSVGISEPSVCDSDITVSGYSCVTADLKALDFSPLTIPLQYSSSRVLTLADDKEAKEVYIYVYRYSDGVNRDYSQVSMTLNTDSFYTMRLPDEDTSFFKNYQIDPVSISANLSLVKYRITSIYDNIDWNADEREYIVRELIDYEHREEASSVLPSGMIYGVKDTASGIEVVQNSLNVYTARQLLVESYIHIADKGSLPLNYDSRIQGQSILLFDIFRNGEIFLEKLRSVELQASYYQWYGALNLEVQNNTERGEKVVQQMISSRWKSGTEGTLPENFHQRKEINNTSLIIVPQAHEIDYKPSYWHLWQTRKYKWNDLDFTKNLDTANKHVDGSLLNDYTYYAVLKTFDFEISPKGYRASDGNNYWQIANREDGYLPFTFTEVSLASFWYDEGTKVKRGIVMSTFNDSYGTVQLVKSSSNGIPNFLTAIIAVVAVIVLAIVLQLVGILIPVVKMLFEGFKALFKAVFYLIKYSILALSWPFRALFRKIRGG